MRGINHREDFTGQRSWMNSSPSGSTTTTQSTNPWAGQQPYLTDIYGQASNLDQTVTPQYYPFNTYAPLTSQQQGVMSNLINYGTSGGNSSLNAANNYTTSALSPGYTAGTQGAFDKGQSVLSNELNSSYLNPANSPTYNTAIDNALSRALPAANASFVNGNRSDSGLAQAASTTAAANAAGGLAQQQYQVNQGIQNQAAGQAANNLLTQQGTQARTALTAPIIDQTQSADLTNALSTSGMTQQDLQNQINANVSRYNYGQMLPWNQLSMYESAITGAGNPGSSSSTSQPYFSNPVANLTSAASGLGSLGMLGMLAFSDRRLKTDIHKIGESDSGFPLYTFRYKDDPIMSRHIGLMAQDVEKKRPGAVLDTPRGKMVNYLEALAA